MPAEGKKFEKGREDPEVPTPPEGGWGWMIVLACFLTTMCTRAVSRCVSIFFAEFQQHFEQDYFTTAWIHSMVDCMTMLFAPLSGFLGNRFTCRVTVIAGGLLSSTGLILSSFASRPEHLHICIGILAGVGFALGFTPSLAMVGKYFSERKALAYGISVSGAGIGTLILAPLVQLLIEHYSWRGALLVLGGFVSNMCVCGALMRPLRPKGRKTKVLQNNVGNHEEESSTASLDSEDTRQESTECIQVEPKQMDVDQLKDAQVILVAKLAILQNFGPKKENLGPGNIIQLSSQSLSDPSLTDHKVAECNLFSNTVTETRSDPETANGFAVEHLKLMDTSTEDSGLSESNPNHMQKSFKSFNSPENTKSSSRGCSLLGFRNDFRFLILPDFLVLGLSILFLAYGNSGPLVHLFPYALKVGLEHQQAAFLLSTFGVSSIVGNITFGWIMDRKCVRRYRLHGYAMAIGMKGLCCMFITFLTSFPFLVLFTFLFGYLGGAFVALIPVVTSDVVGPSCLPLALGVIYFLHGIPYLVSPPIGGWLVDTTGNYKGTFLLCGASFMFSAMVIAAAILIRRCQMSKSSSPAASNVIDNEAAAYKHSTK